MTLQLIAQKEPLIVKLSDDEPAQAAGSPPKTNNMDSGSDDFSRALKVLVAIPCYNEEIAISGIVLRAKKYADYILVIDDGSTDRTAELAEISGAHVLRHYNNRGKGAGIRHAFHYARMSGADALVLIDGDGQHDPDEIPSLLAPIINGEVDIVNGSRFLSKKQNHVPKFRRIGQEILTLATNFGSNMKLTDSQNGFRAFSKKTFNGFSFNETGMGIESEMIIDAAKAQFTIKEVPINVRYDIQGSTYNPVVHGFSVLFSTLKIIAKRRPLLS